MTGNSNDASLSETGNGAMYQWVRRVIPGARGRQLGGGRVGGRGADRFGPGRCVSRRGVDHWCQIQRVQPLMKKGRGNVGGAVVRSAEWAPLDMRNTGNSTPKVC